jgi:hypothetical protein
MANFSLWRYDGYHISGKFSLLFFEVIAHLRQQEMAERLGLSLLGVKFRVLPGGENLWETLLNCWYLELEIAGARPAPVVIIPLT